MRGKFPTPLTVVGDFEIVSIRFLFLFGYGRCREIISKIRNGLVGRHDPDPNLEPRRASRECQGDADSVFSNASISIPHAGTRPVELSITYFFVACFFADVTGMMLLQVAGTAEKK